MMTSLGASLFALLALIHVSVAQGPSLQLLPSSILKALHDDVYVSCTAIVDEPSLVTEMKWVGPNGNDIPNDDGSISTMEGFGGPGKLDLLINDLQEKDTGLYNCTATYAGNQQLSTGLLVEAFMDIDFGDTPTHQTPFIGTESKIRCVPTAKPAPQVDWLKDNIPLQNDENHIIQQDGILIKEVTEANEGVYRCRARVPQIGSIDYKDIQVEVYIPPKINIPPEDITGKEKETVTFQCGATGKPLPAYSWVNKDNEPLEGKEGYFVDAEKGVLNIMELRPELAGTYRCTAENAAGVDTAEANLLVLTKPKVEEYLNITQAVDLNAEMKCIATGSPLPKIVFKKETNEEPFIDSINYDDRIEVEQTTDDEGRAVGILKIRGVVRSDDGLYTCTAQSDGGETQVWGHITVEFPPTFEEQSRTEEWSWEQAPVNLTCLATAIPNATIQWYFRNEEIRATDENLEVLSYGPLGVLRVTPSSLYYGTYTCQATNTLGSAEHDLELKEAHVPGPVPSVEVEKKTATTITWKIVEPVDNGGLPIQSFIVEYHIRDQGWDTAERQIWTKGASYTLDKLVPQEAYVFRFAAKNEAGEGEWGGDKVVEMPKRAAPEEPLIFNADSPVIENPYKTKYNLQWKVPLDNGEPIDFFNIIYYQVHNSSGKWVSSSEKTNEESKYPGATSYIIKGLIADTYYKIELRAHNSIGFSTPAEVIMKTAYDPVGPQPSSGGVGTGLIVGIIVIVVLIVLVVVDVSCYCTKNAGLTATIVGKRGSKDKDKEAMLEDGKNASDEKHEGNGQMKPAKEEEAKPVQQETEDKVVKETTEPTETTPMIQGRHNSKISAFVTNDRNAHQVRPVIQKQRQIVQQQRHGTRRHLVSTVNDYRRSYSESYYLEENCLVKNLPPGNTYEEIGYDLDGHPLSLRLAMENSVLGGNGNIRNSISTPVLDYDTDSSVDSTYDIPFHDERPRRCSYMSETSAPPRPTKPKPPLPVRNPKTKLTWSQEDLLNIHDAEMAASHSGSWDSPLEHSKMYDGVRHSADKNIKVVENKCRMKYVMASNEALDRMNRQADDVRMSRERLNHSHLPSPVSGSSRENLTTGSIPQSSYKSPSQSSYSTFYQPADAPFYLKQSKVAFGVAGYDDPMTAQWQGTQCGLSPQQAALQTPQRRKVVLAQPKKPKVPPPPTPESKHANKSKQKIVTTLYFVERPQHPNLSQSMDRLDDGHCLPLSTEESSSSIRPLSSMSSARSLGSLLSSEASQRSYNQPTLI